MPCQVCDSDAAMITRFAPSPTGLLHLGHAYAALVADESGTFLLRLEDIDQGRCRPAFEEAIYEDLAWLGLSWPEPVMRQSERMEAYGTALKRLAEQGLTYPCFCTRADIAAEIERAGGAPHGPDGPVYPGICRDLSDTERTERIAAGEPHAIRLNMEKALAQTGPLTWTDQRLGSQTADPMRFGDVVLARKDTPTSYHLAVVVDDAAQRVELVTRGEDLALSTDVHRVLQVLLGLPEPAYLHHKLITDADGKKFSKRDHAVTLQALRAAGKTPEEIRGMVGL